MPRNLILLFFSLVFLVSCEQTQASFVRQYLNETKLENQTFTIDPSKDTLLVSQSGIRIQIAQGTFSSAEKVTIEFKEALDFESMLQAGLFTVSGDKILSSAGMFYLNTKENLEIKKPIGIEVPAKTALQEMQLFKGEQADGKINWENPQRITIAPNPVGANLGKTLFENNCASCHRIERALTGPALAGVTERWSKRIGGLIQMLRSMNVEIGMSDSTAHYDYRSFLYDYTKHSTHYSTENLDEPYVCCLRNKWPSAMTMFPNLSDSSLDALYKYIDDETERVGIDTKQFESACDSCSFYNLAVMQLENERNKLATDNGPSVIRNREPTPLTIDTTTIAPPLLADFKQQVIPVAKNADYYQVTIKETGWYNIDILLQERNNVSESKLMVRLQGNYEKKIPGLFSHSFI